MWKLMALIAFSILLTGLITAAILLIGPQPAKEQPMPARCYFCKTNLAPDMPLHTVRATTEVPLLDGNLRTARQTYFACDPCIRTNDRIITIEIPRDEYVAALDLVEEAADNPSIEEVIP